MAELRRKLVIVGDGACGKVRVCVRWMQSLVVGSNGEPRMAANAPRSEDVIGCRTACAHAAGERVALLAYSTGS